MVFDAVLGASAPGGPFGPVGADGKFASVNVDEAAAVGVGVVHAVGVSPSCHVTLGGGVVSVSATKSPSVWFKWVVGVHGDATGSDSVVVSSVSGQVGWSLFVHPSFENIEWPPF